MKKESVTIKPDSSNTFYMRVNMVISVGKLDAMINALRDRNTPVAQDLLGMIEALFKRG